MFDEKNEVLTFPSTSKHLLDPDAGLDDDTSQEEDRENILLQNPTNFTEILPVEVILKIIGSLSFKKIVKLSMVSKNFFRLTTQYFIKGPLSSIDENKLSEILDTVYGLSWSSKESTLNLNVIRKSYFYDEKTMAMIRHVAYAHEKKLIKDIESLNVNQKEKQVIAGMIFIAIVFVIAGVLSTLQRVSHVFLHTVGGNLLIVAANVFYTAAIFAIAAPVVGAIRRFYFHEVGSWIPSLAENKAKILLKEFNDQIKAFIKNPDNFQEYYRTVFSFDKTLQEVKVEDVTDNETLQEVKVEEMVEESNLEEENEEAVFLPKSASSEKDRSMVTQLRTSQSENTNFAQWFSWFSQAAPKVPVANSAAEGRPQEKRNDGQQSSQSTLTSSISNFLRTTVSSSSDNTGSVEPPAATLEPAQGM